MKTLDANKLNMAIGEHENAQAVNRGTISAMDIVWTLCEKNGIEPDLCDNNFDACQIIISDYVIGASKNGESVTSFWLD